MSDRKNSFLNIQNFSDISVADFGSRDKIKKEWSKGLHQKYIGEVLHGNLHRHGFYFIEEGEKIFYDGLFYANKLEGYAQIFYNDGSDFQGLFKNNLRFGPGILTYPNGEQDVGLWEGQHMTRIGSLNEDNLTPRLAITPTGQLKLLKHRILVPVCPKHTDVAHDILEKLGASEKILQQSHKLYNLEAGNKHNVFFNKKFFDEQFYGEYDCHIDILPSDEEDDVLSDNLEKEERKEETPGDSSDINIERVRQISEGLEIIESKLKAVQRYRVEIQNKVEYCRACCSSGQQEERKELSTCIEEEKVSEEEINFTASQIPRKVSFAVNSFESEKPISDFNLEDLYTDGLFDDEETDFSNSIEKSDTDVYTQTDPVATNQVNDYLKGTCTCDEGVDVDDLLQMEQRLEAAVKDERFFESITRNLKEKLEKHLRQAQSTVKMRTRKLLVNHVLSWNNEKNCVIMLKHSFHHRKSEYMVNFKVSDLIAGNRTLFGKPGVQERNSTDFLTACSRGDLKAIFHLIKKNDVNVNICDAKGNNGVFFAAINNRLDVIRVLVNLGAKLNQENDEGLLPLSMCLLIYLSQKYEVGSWENSFLPKVQPVTEPKDAHKWYPNVSILDLPSNKEKHVSKKKFKKYSSESKEYIFDMSFVTPTETKEASDTVYKPIPTRNTVDTKINDDSIKTLLKYGANPNAGGSPLPTLILSLFTQVSSLVEAILDAGADANVAIENNVTSLHVMTSSKCTRANVNICQLLIMHNCDPKLKTSTNHWLKQKMEILGKDVNPDEVVDLGKNPLHILCMRRDFLTDNCSFFRDMISNFNDSDIDFNDRYLGHTPLSLAVLVGNQNLVETLMNLHIIDPHQVLGYNMGNVLTIYILKRYEDLIPRNAKKILDYLTMSGVNVLSPIGDFENAVAFMENEVSKDKQRSKSIKILKQTPANDQTKNDVLRKALRKHIKELGRQTIKKYIQSIAVENLYNLIEDNLTEHECVSTLAGFLTPKITISNLQILFEHGKFKPGRFDKNICLKLIDIVKTHSKINQKNSKSKSNSKIITNTSDYNLILDTFTIRRMEKEETELELLPPGLDDTSKYKVCYHCLRKRNKLLVCPKCQLIYFCSDLCNKANLKLENVHPCRTDFYASELKRLTSPNALEEQENLEGLYKRVQDSCEKRRLQNLQKGFELGRKHYKDGIKFSKSHVLKTKIKITPTMISLLGSVSSLSKTDILYHDNLSSTINKTYSESVRFDQSTKDTSSEIKNRLPIISLINRVCNKKNPNCDCEICTAYKKQAWKIKCKCLPVGSTKKTVTDVKVGEVDTNVTVRKLRVAPKQCKEFIKLLTQKCPNIDFSSVILPYTCYSNGNLYYKFLENDYYTRMYDVDGNYQ